MLKTGTIIAERYEILGKIGTGGMADVYKAKDHKLNRFVAVKVLKPEFREDTTFIRKFRSEAQAAAGLTHPNIVNVFDVGDDGGVYYIVMELIEGITLKEYIAKKGKLSIKEATSIAIQVSMGLEAAHNHGIVHRDVKPQNIIISTDGKVKVTDFGIARAASSNTISSNVMGSVHYSSPEQVRGGYSDEKSDIYSLGITLYEMVTGRVPFDADTPVSVALKHMQEEPVEPIELNPNLPIAVNKIIMRALQKDTTLRYQTASEMLVDLKKSLKDPEGDFVEELEYDPTAKTQVIDTNAYRDNKQTKNSSGKKDGKFKTFVKTHKGLSMFIGLLLLFVLSLGGTMLVLNLTNPPEVAMPNVVGLSKEEAQKEIENVKLKFEIEKEEYNKDVPEGFIISQDPTYMEKFNKVKQGSTVKVVVSKGEEKTTVPKVVGMEKDKAVKALEDAKLKVEIVEESSKKVQEGYVISQETSPDTEAFAGDTIKIHVSTGVEKATVPDVIGKSQADAKKTLEAQGFVVAVTTSEDSSKENGIVLKQSLDSGKTVEKGSTVTITVNSYEASKTMSVNINVKAITGGYSEETSNSNTTENKTVKTVSITLKSGNNTLYSDSGVDKNTTSKSTTISGKGSMDLTLTITDSNGGSWTRTKSVNFSTDSSVNFN